MSGRGSCVPAEAADGPGEALARTSEREGMGISGTGSVGLSAPSGARRPTGMRSTEGLGADGAAEVAQCYRRVLGERAMWIGTREQAGEHLGVLGARARGVVGDVVVAMAENWVLVDPRVHSEAAIAMPGVHGSFTPAETEVPLLITEA